MVIEYTPSLNSISLLTNLPPGRVTIHTKVLSDWLLDYMTGSSNIHYVWILSGQTTCCSVTVFFNISSPCVSCLWIQCGCFISVFTTSLQALHLKSRHPILNRVHLSYCTPSLASTETLRPGSISVTSAHIRQWTKATWSIIRGSILEKGPSLANYVGKNSRWSIILKLISTHILLRRLLVKCHKMEQSC